MKKYFLVQQMNSIDTFIKCPECLRHFDIDLDKIPVHHVALKHGADNVADENIYLEDTNYEYTCPECGEKIGLYLVDLLAVAQQKLALADEMNDALKEEVSRLKDLIKCEIGAAELTEESLRAEIKHYLGEVAALTTENELLKDAAQQTPVNSPSQICRSLHIQNCHACEDVNCGDNTTPSIVELRKENERIKQTNMELIHSNDELGIIAEQLSQANPATGQWNYDDLPAENIDVIVIYLVSYFKNPCYFFGKWDHKVHKHTRVLSWAHVIMPEGVK